ncbi:winged helix-turn-helix transcriptional regulator [Desertivirga brevis]|uniref:winged helix-turn-helix transcriptional regulator n=1 Tax=Desertivirga brevis TaxID=2810310 RepID=UPI001A97AEB0|nr:helix-turn-helix domain-containing protein [Pedobacter sp. SYSU D00873]
MPGRKATSTYSINEKHIINCNLTYAIHIIEGRWKLMIIDKLEQKRMRFSELKTEFAHITERMLSLQLRTMEQDGLIKRTIYPEVPPRVEYELTTMALELTPILNQLSKWAAKNRKTPFTEIIEVDKIS